MFSLVGIQDHALQVSLSLVLKNTPLLREDQKGSHLQPLLIPILLILAVSVVGGIPSRQAAPSEP